MSKADPHRGRRTPPGSIFEDPNRPHQIDPGPCYYCGKTKAQTKLQMIRRGDEYRVICYQGPCTKKAANNRPVKNRLPGVQKLQMTPEELAEKMAKARAAPRRKDLARSIHHHVLTGEFPIHHRHYQVLIYFLGGLDVTEIARVVGYKDARFVREILKRPELQAARRKVEEAQFEKIVAGEFGVQAAARANAGKAMRRIIDEVDNTQARPSDKLRAAELNLKISGDLVEKKVHAHLHQLVRGFSAAELEAFVKHDRWPDRLKPLVDKLGLTDQRATPPESS